MDPLRAKSSLVPAELTGYITQSGCLVWPVVVALAFPILLVTLEATPIGLDFIYAIIVEPALLITWGFLGLLAAIIAVKEIRRRHWKAVAASAVLPAAILSVGLHFSGFINFCNYAGDVLYFFARRSTYAQVITKHATAGEPRLMVFNRGGMSWSSRGFVFDESDQILRQPALQSADWKERASGSELSCGYQAQPLMPHLAIAKHWYVASFPC